MLLLFTWIQPPVVRVPWDTICQNERLRAPFGWLFRHLLDEPKFQLPMYGGLLLDHFMAVCKSFNQSWPLNPIMASSMEPSYPSEKAALKLAMRGSRNGRSLYSASYPGCPLGTY